jgi:hypothetical protein
LPVNKQGFVYAEEADVINVAIFGMTAKEWRAKNKELAKSGNIRDYASIEQLTVLANLESINSMLISKGLDKNERFKHLRTESIRQLTTLLKSRGILLLEQA